MNAISSPLVVAIESVWADLRARHADIPDVVVAMASGSMGRRGVLKLGHFGRDRWKVGQQVMPELFVGGEGLAMGARYVLGTLLHEAAHGAAVARGIDDTSRAGAYHNGKFRDIVREFGLTVERTRDRGWTVTTVSDATADTYKRQIRTLDAVIVAYRRDEHDPADGDGEGRDGDKSGKTPRNGRALVCTCTSARRVRAAQKTIDAGPILCGVCREPFAAEAEE
ncbi:hypothetical protein ACFXG4_33425 [Nocardia sp. NPDC059246]|uniref:hypothetical protein n=1 Tax=unclassified Nocardia TaxID=2637762 RepID=UPI0036AE456A